MLVRIDVVYKEWIGLAEGVFSEGKRRTPEDWRNAGDELLG